jgi:hypothetical protein
MNPLKKTLVLACLATGALYGLLGLTTAPPASADSQWVANHCFNDHHGISLWKRADARAYGLVAADEGYQYAGGCWNDDDQDDTPNLATYEDGGEGPDCSGLVFKSWFLVNDRGAGGGTWYNKFQDVHGPYSSTMFHNGVDGPFFVLANKFRSNTLYMDAFAREGHIGLLYTNTGTPDGNDYILEARCNDCGTNIFIEDYRSDDAYVGVRRKGWTADCYPNCTSPDARPATVVVP